MKAFRVQQIVAKDGEVVVKGIPYKEGQTVEVIVSPQPSRMRPHSHLSVRELRNSGLIGLWKDRDDIQDNIAYARRIREQAQNRGDINYDFTR
ncbi:MAG: hypothetical protein U9Q82_10945 [Chloroflexota bacterium]|nr:hypothetical protein [Chloroflexota bacterium]